MAPPIKQGGFWRGGERRGGGQGINGGRAGQKKCRFLQEGHCRYGQKCKYSHELDPKIGASSTSGHFRVRPDRTPEQQLGRENYQSWKNTLRITPRNDDTQTAQRLWDEALKLLTTGERDWQQRLPQDLAEPQGLEHVQYLMGLKVNACGAATFIRLARPFLMVITHPALLDCLSVDIYVGDLYTFVSGSGGTRAVPFFIYLANSLLQEYITSSKNDTKSMEHMIIATVIALREVMRRIPKALFHDDLPPLIAVVKNLAEAFRLDESSVAFHTIAARIGELDRMIRRSQGALVDDADLEELRRNKSKPVVTSTYPRDIQLPGNRHDNDKKDITQIQILPTEGEIRSEIPEFLPSPDIDQPHFLEGVERHFDTHFRLLRHDIFGELKSVVGELLNNYEKNPKINQVSKQSLGNMHAHSYSEASVRHLTFSKKEGLEVTLSFPQPIYMRKKSVSERRRWWEESKRMEEGSLLCLLTHEGQTSSLHFLTVSQKTTDSKDKHGLASDGYYAAITAKLAARQNQTQLKSLIRLSITKSKFNLLIEFPGVLLATFIPTLESIQQMQSVSQLPFADWIIPNSTTGRYVNVPELRVPPPLYARAAGFRFDLKAILQDPTTTLALSAGANDRNIPRELKQLTSLDHGQCEALITALTREFALIQGPPGTGKSHLGVHIMKVLITNKSKAELGPIVVVCYTNHALDQFLEHLVDIGIEKIIRIGGHSSSSILEGKNLRLVARDEAKTGSERHLIGRSFGEMEQQGKTVSSKLNILRGLQKASWVSLNKHLRLNYPQIHHQFSRIDEEGFTRAGKLEPFDLWMTAQGENLENLDKPLQNLKAILTAAKSRIYQLAVVDRRLLLGHLLHEVEENAVGGIFDAIQEDDTLRQQVRDVYDEVDRRVLETADVIGVTTSGLAKRISVLRHVNAKVVVCEEAGEVLEAHMLSALIPSVQHLIQIGDHQQLRPQINNFSLSLESREGIRYQLDRSQFERLSVGTRGQPPFPIAQLNIQRRMRPEISALVRNTLYSKLEDHEVTKVFPDVVGMRKNVYWYDHINYEDGARQEGDQKSKTNSWEVRMAHALVRHIIRQGIYDSKDIAVLTPYAGQLQKLRAVMRNDFEVVLSDRDQETLTKEGFVDGSPASPSEEPAMGPGFQKKAVSELLRCATIDNFQGEEAKVIVISLVRSNKEKTVGFLKTTNRINVLLSRAKHGMYIIGNADTYSNIPMWAQVIGMLRGNDSVGGSFSLCCPRHAETEILVSKPEDFAILSPEGGCRKTCDRRLDDCGHRCLAKFHSDPMHKAFKCPQPCERLFSPCGHECPKSCGDACGRCRTKIDDVKLMCGHIKEYVNCFETDDLSKILCTVPIRKRNPSCGHIVEVPCYEDISSALFRCPKPCTVNLACGHKCHGICGTCNISATENQPAKIEHSECHKICGRRLGTCNHTCPKKCHDSKECGLCFAPCEVRCAHSMCDKKCHEACAPCIQDCTWACEHQGLCTMPCAAPCNRLPCSQRCAKNLTCGHQCPSLCGEICPEGYCQMCSDKQEQRVDILEFRSFGEVNLDTTPIVVLACGHFFTAETLDGHAGMADAYDIDGEGSFTAFGDISRSLARAIPRCPDCQCSIRQYVTQRYNRAINRCVIDEMSKRFLVSGKAYLLELEGKTNELDLDLQKSRDKLLERVKRAGSQLTPANAVQIVQGLESKFMDSKKLIREVSTFLNSVTDKAQPARKLYDATVRAIRAKRPLEEQMKQLTTNDISTVSRDQRVLHGARAVQLKLSFVILADRLQLLQDLKPVLDKNVGIKLPGDDPNQSAERLFKSCEQFIAACSGENLPKLNVEARIHFGRTARLYQSCSFATKSSDLHKSTEYVERAKKYLEEAEQLCVLGFQNADSLQKGVKETLRLLGKEWYEPVSAEETAAIKAAMVSGSGGIATHSGHWYNCQNGHPFAIGECGMPMEEARCPECGARVGGTNHAPAAGVTRAMEMER